jgi:hypothetical protein
MKRLYNAKEAASYCGVSVPTFEAHFCVAAIRVGNRKLYDVQDIDKAIDRMKGVVANDNVPEKYKLLGAL